MADVTQTVEIVTVFKTDTSQVDAATEKVANDVEKVNTSIKGTSDELGIALQKAHKLVLKLWERLKGQLLLQV